MKKILHKIVRYLPIILLVTMMLVPTEAQAFLGAAKKFLGIDTIDNCVTPLFGEKHVCYFCGMFEIIFNASAKVASLSYSIFHTDLGQLIIIFLAVSLALITLRNVAAMGTQDPGALMNMLASRIFVCAAVYYIVTRDYYNILNKTIVPILSDGLQLIGRTSVSSNIGNIGGFGDDEGVLGRTLGALGGDTMPRAIGQMIISFINDIEDQIQDLFEYGRWAMCLGNGPERLFHVLPNPFMVIDGLTLYMGGIVFMVTYPWIMADAVIQLGVALALLPFALAGYAFSGTKQYLAKLFGWILHSLFVFIFMGILITCTLGYIHDTIWNAIRFHSNPLALFLNPVTGLAFFGINMIKIVFVLAIGWMYMPEIRDLAQNFSEGASLSAASNVGKSVTEPIANAAEKLGDYGAQTAGRAAAATVHGASKYARSRARIMTKDFVNAVGSTDLNGNKTLKVAGVRFTTVKNGDGSTFLKRERKTLFGRRRVMVADKYSTTILEYDRKGNLVRKETKFKNSFIKKYLVDEDGKINVGAMQTLLNSSVAQDPDFRQAIVEQFAIEVAKLKGDNVSPYFKARNVVFNPANPGKIYIEQIDHDGKKTLIDLNVNMLTGQYRLAYSQDMKRTHPVELARRKSKMKKIIKSGGRRKTLFAEYEMKRDSHTGERYYTRTRRKWLFFGPKIEKDFYKDRTAKRKVSSAKRIDNRKDNRTIIENELRSVMPDRHGRRVKKTLFFTYESYVNHVGQTIYTARLRKGWNIKNYYRGAKFAGNMAIRAPLALATTAINLPIALVHQIFRPKESIKALKYFGSAGRGLFRRATWTTKAGAKAELLDFGQGLAHTIVGRTIIEDFWKGGNLKKAWDNRDRTQTGNITEFTETATTKIDSATGATLNMVMDDGTVEKTSDGTKTTTDNISGETSSETKEVGRRKMRISGTFGDIEINGVLDSDGNVVDEITRYHYSDLIQKGHDLFTYQHGGNQVVEDNGNIAPDLLTSPKDLLWGFDEIFGKTAVGSVAMADFMKRNIFQAGRQARSNKIRTRISSAMV